MRSSPMASKMAPPGGPFAISSVRTG
jgi:hypothetical protein